MPQIVPRKLFARCDLKNEPCPQSWKIINARVRRPPAGNASASVIQYEYDKLTYIRVSNTKYGIKVLATCQRLRCRLGFWYFATICCQVRFSGLAVPTLGSDRMVPPHIVAYYVRGFGAQVIPAMMPVGPIALY